MIDEHREAGTRREPLEQRREPELRYDTRGEQPAVHARADTPPLRGGDLAANAFADADARLPAEQRLRAIALVVQPRERRLQAIERDRRRLAERAERQLAELAEREHDARAAP